MGENVTQQEKWNEEGRKERDLYMSQTAKCELSYL